MEKSKRKYKKTSCYLIYSVLGISTGILFRLSFPFLVLMMVVGFLFLPKLMRNTEKSRYHQKRFEDINSYMEQLLYSFRKSKRILASLQDIKIQFKNKPMEKLIEQAEQHILNTYDSEGDTEFEALSMIEQEYPCVKLKTIHRFLLKVENLGGSFDKTIDLLLEDRSLWEQRQNHLYQEKKRKRNLVTASIVMSILLCIVFVRILPADMDISKNIFVQSATVIMWFLDILVYAKVDEKISKDWLDSGELSSPKDTMKRYKKITEFDKKKELKKSCRYAFFLTVIAVIFSCFHYMRAVWIAAAGIPFMLFQLGFALALARILQDEKPAGKWYALLGKMGLCCFLTRYYGIYVWIVTGLYILALFVAFRQKKDKAFLVKSVKLMITAFASGVLSLAYLMMNKLMNGMASGVSRTMWWDDYRALTDDLIESLLTEFFNIFSLQIPEFIESFPFNLKVFAVLIILIGLGWFVAKNCKHFTRESVLITMAVMYYLIFICIRYVSSMDSFYFRFFEPGTFLLCIGVIGLLLPYLRGKKAFRYLGGAVTALVLLAVVSVWENGGLDHSDSYYEAVTKQWEEAYAEIPERSVIIFNDIDFRSSWYRPDVVDGTITPADTLDSLRETYYGSEYLCIRAEFVETMLESGDYEEGVQRWLREGLTMTQQKDFVVLSLRDELF